jgi:hypothetical protein
VANTYRRIGDSSGSATVEYFNLSFTSASWVGPVSGYYFITIPQTSHNKVNNITVKVYESIAGAFEEVETFIQINASLDVTIRIDASTDTRFDGKVLIL